MGSASSMLTQYDIEEVQEYSNNLCKLICWEFLSLVLIFRLYYDCFYCLAGEKAFSLCLFYNLF